jgi:hypothetical protein
MDRSRRSSPFTSCGIVLILLLVGLQRDTYSWMDRSRRSSHFTSCGIVLILLLVVVAGVSSLPRIMPFDALNIDEGGVVLL